MIDNQNISYNQYTYQPANVNAWDHLSDFFLGTNRVQTANQNKLNWEMFKEQNKYNEYMSNTAYQRAVQDMEKAGINPMLAALNGGASSPSSANVSQGAQQGTASVYFKRMQEERDRLINALIALANATK